MRQQHEDGTPFHPEEQMEFDIQEQKAEAEDVFKRIIEEHDKLDVGQVYQLVNRYGSYLVRAQALQFSLDAYRKAY